ncbi:hypothetical protein [Clostridium lundense]|uniref:hypothetical protein n=1 Tax=Clostridium lundense TaxID=319475 RepID=UPI000485762E|nr:hypothetical protein [Clostridium lundense]
MRLEVTTVWGVQIHTLNSRDLKRFEEWYEDKISRNIFTYSRDGYAWHIIKPQVKGIKYID